MYLMRSGTELSHIATHRVVVVVVLVEATSSKKANTPSLQIGSR